MRHLIGNLKNHKKAVIVLMVLLFVQAYCDLALPEYMQDIIDVGIQNRGVDCILPVKMVEEDFREATEFMTDEEVTKWEASYSSHASDSQIIYVREISEDSLSEYEEDLLVPIVLKYQSDQVLESGGDFTEEGEGVEITRSANPEDIRKEMEETVKVIGDRTLRSMGIAYAVACDERAGVDIAVVQKRYLWTQGGKMAIMALLMFLAAATAAFFAARTGASIGRELRRKIFTNVMSYSNAEMDKFSAASLITRSTNDVQQVQQATTMMLRMVLFAPIMCAWGIVKVVRTGAGMGHIIAAAVIMIVVFVAILFSVTVPKFKMMQSLIDHVNLVAREILTGLPVIRAFGREKTEEARFDTANRKLMDTQLFTGRVMSLMQPTMQLIMFGLTVTITWVAAAKIDAGDLQVGVMTAFITYSMMVVMSFLMITVMSIMLPRAGVAADRIHEVVTTESSIAEPSEPVKMGDTAAVEFRDVCFRYPGADNDVLTDISFVAEPGKVTAIIGSTGSGKTTLINLIPRFYDVTSGQVLVGGADVRDLSISELRNAIGLVPQKGTLFSGTIASNIAFGMDTKDNELVDCSKERIMNAAAIAQAAGFIEEKEDGYDSEISQGGSNVSGGQKQRLAIARAIAKDPEILIFDDSFSALDMKTDRLLRKELAEKTKDTTRIIVAQRVSTILGADQILVLDQGRIAGRGTHRELMESCDIYREIANSQLSPEELEVIA